jgi:glycogen debranching enzyme
MASSPKSQTVYLLPITDKGAPDVVGSYIYLPPPCKDPYSVRFSILGTSSICREGSLWVNIPAKGEEFKRDRYKEYKLVYLANYMSVIADHIKVETRLQ